MTDPNIGITLVHTKDELTIKVGEAEIKNVKSYSLNVSADNPFAELDVKIKAPIVRVQYEGRKNHIKPN